jgi:hypothetical protein
MAIARAMVGADGDPGCRYANVAKTKALIICIGRFYLHFREVKIRKGPTLAMEDRA